VKSWVRTWTGTPAGRHSRPALFEVADQLLRLGVHADHRLAGREGLADGGIDVPELGVPVGVLAALSGLGVGLQAEAQLVQ